MNTVGGKIYYGADRDLIRKSKKNPLVTQRKKREHLTHFAEGQGLTLRATKKYAGEKPTFRFYIRGTGKISSEAFTLDQGYSKYVRGNK